MEIKFIIIYGDFRFPMGIFDPLKELDCLLVYGNRNKALVDGIFDELRKCKVRLILFVTFDFNMRFDLRTQIYVDPQFVTVRAYVGCQVIPFPNEEVPVVERCFALQLLQVDYLSSSRSRSILNKCFAKDEKYGADR